MPKRFHQYCILSSVTFNTLRPRQNVHRFTDIFKYIFLKENSCILINISLEIISKAPIDNASDICSAPNKPLAIICTTVGIGYRRIYVSLGLNELTHTSQVTHIYVG